MQIYFKILNKEHTLTIKNYEAILGSHLKFYVLFCYKRQAGSITPGRELEVGNGIAAV